MKLILAAGVCAGVALAMSAAFAAASYAYVPDGELAAMIDAPFPAAATTPSLMDSETTTPGGAGSLPAKEIAVLTNQGISQSRAIQALGVQSKVTEADLQRKLEVALGSAYAGMWYDNAAAQLHIGATSPASRRTAEEIVARAGLAADVIIEPVRSTMVQLLTAQHQWNHKLAKLLARGDVTTGIEPGRNAVSVTLSSAVHEPERTVLEREAAAADVNLFVTVSTSPYLGLVQEAKECNNFTKNNANCEPSITAGVEIWSKIKCKKVANQVGARFFATQKECEEKKVEKGKEGEWEREKEATENPVECTAGPVTRPIANRNERVLLTAGHCIEDGGGKNIEWFAFTRPLAEPLIGKAIEFKVGGAAGAKIGDYGDIKIEPGGGWQTGNANNPVLAVTAEWKKAEETRYRVKGERLPAEKAMDCHEGASSGEQCGEITKVNATAIAENGNTVEGLVEDTAESKGGDSGGPWLFVATENNPNHEAVMEGTHVGKIGTKSAFQPLKKVEAGPPGSLEALTLELLTTANEVIPGGPKWVTCLPKSGAGQWEDSHCTKGKTNGGWETSELTTTVEVTSSDKLTLEDSAEKTAVTCTGLDKGKIGAEGSDSVTEISNVKCEFVKEENGKCEASGPVSAKPLNLPWSTHLAERTNASKELEVRDEITSLVSGKEPGWTLTCRVDGVLEVSDECSGNTSTKVRSNRTEGSVEAEFEKESPKGGCSLSKEKTGVITGTTISKLRMSNGELLAFWVLASALKT
jgi:hypothetical protein